MKIDLSRVFGGWRSQLEDFIGLIWNRGIPFMMGFWALKYNEFINAHLWAMFGFVILMLLNMAFHLEIRFNQEKHALDINAPEYQVKGKFK